MASSDAIRRLAIVAPATFAFTSCVTQLDDFHGPPDPTTVEETSTQRDTVDATVVVTSREASSDAGTVEAAAPEPVTPPCAEGLLNSEGLCVPLLRCAPGTFVSEANGVELCSPCASGQFSTDYDATQCDAWRNCPVGDYVATPGTSTTNRECAPCPNGETTTVENSGDCSGASDCAAGTVKREDTCAPCSAGTYCSGKDTSEVACERYTWDDDSDPATPCVVKTSCAPGQFVFEEGDEVTDRMCSFCPDETFSTEDNAATCSDWSACAPGSYVTLQGTSASDRECAECSSGTFSSNPNTVECETWTTCPAPSEYATTTPNAEYDRTCGPCDDGYTASQDNAEVCDVPVPVNLVTNYDFESNTAGWLSWLGTLSVTSARAHTGSRSLLVTGPSTGPAATNLDTVVAPGNTYHVSFWVTLGNVSAAQVNLTRALTCNGNTTYEWLTTNQTVANNAWTQLVGEFSIASSCGAPKLQLYVEGTTSNVDLYVDNVSVTKAP